jgi:hypothetical protein
MPKFSGQTALAAGETESFTSSGFIALSLFQDAACSKPAGTGGFPVNTCFMADGFTYIVRLKAGMLVILLVDSSPLFPKYGVMSQLYFACVDTCAGGVIEYYTDPKCKKIAGTSELSGLPCSDMGHGEFASAECTSSAQPKVFAASIVMR